MKKAFPILFLIMVCWASNSQAADITQPDSRGQGMWKDYLNLIVISECAANERYGIPQEGTENTSTTARSFYPANSLNVLKKALYALEAHPSDLPDHSVAG